MARGRGARVTVGCAVAALCLGGIVAYDASPAQEGSRALAVMDAGLYADSREWARTRANSLAEIRQATTHEHVYSILSRAIVVAGGRHSRVYPFNAMTTDVPNAPVPEPITVATSGRVATVTIPGNAGVAYDPDELKRQSRAGAAQVRTADACGYIVDLRMNTGGRYTSMLGTIAPLLPNGEALSFVHPDESGEWTTAETVDITDSGLASQVRDQRGTIVWSNTTPIGKGTKLNDRPVAVLTSASTASSGEATLLATRGAPNVRTFGQETAGLTSGNAGAVFRHYSLQLTRSFMADRTGTVHKETPVVPDVETSYSETESAARFWLAEQGCN